MQFRFYSNSVWVFLFLLILWLICQFPTEYFKSLWLSLTANPDDMSVLDTKGPPAQGFLPAPGWSDGVSVYTVSSVVPAEMRRERPALCFFSPCWAHLTLSSLTATLPHTCICCPACTCYPHYLTLSDIPVFPYVSLSCKLHQRRNFVVFPTVFRTGKALKKYMYEWTKMNHLIISL